MLLLVGVLVHMCVAGVTYLVVGMLLCVGGRCRCIPLVGIHLHVLVRFTGDVGMYVSRI